MLLYLVAGALPIGGLVGVYRSAVRTRITVTGGNPSLPRDQMLIVPMIAAQVDGFVLEPVRARRAVFLIGGGVVVGTIASIWSMFLQ